MSRFVGAGEAARQLGVQRATLYAYVSRGLIERKVAVDGRTSLYSVDDLEALARRVRRRDVEPRPSIDVQIVTRVTTLDESGVRYRGHDVATLARTSGFEQVAELLWGGTLPVAAAWPAPDPDDVRLARGVARSVGGARIPALIAVASALGVRHESEDPAAAARRLIGLTPVVLALGPTGAGTDTGIDTGPDGTVAARLATAWLPSHAETLAPAIDRGLVLLADHELATSTLAVRIAGSTWTGPYPAFVAGLAVLQGVLHGAAGRAVHELLVECEHIGADTALTQRLQSRERIPGFGHKIYKGEDPRLAPLMEAIDLLPDPAGRRDVVADLMRAAGVRITRRANADLGVGALTFVAGLPADLPFFGVARLAGFAAHLIEELGERPLRYRGLARPPSP